MRVTFTNPRVQQQIAWGCGWFEAAEAWAARHGWTIESQTPGRRVLVGGVWYAVEFSAAAQEWQFTREAP
jgi:hypothetical protein